MSKYYTIIDGQCEESLVDWLKTKGYKFGHTIVRALIDVIHIERAFSMIDNDSVLTIIVDTDTINNTTTTQNNRLINNIDFFRKNVKRVVVLTSNKCFEDELVKALNLPNQTALFRLCSVSNIDGFKKKINKSTTGELDNLLTNIDFSKLWSDKLLYNYTENISIIALSGCLTDLK